MRSLEWALIQSDDSFLNSQLCQLVLLQEKTIGPQTACGLEAWIWCVCLILIPILDNPLTFSNPANPPRLVLSMPQALSPPYLLGVNLFWNAALIDLSFVGLYHTSTKLDLIKSKNLHLVESLTFVTTENYLLLCVFLLIPLNANDSYSSRMQKYANIFDVLQFNKSSFLSLFFFRTHS